MSESFMGQIILFAGNFAPRNYMLCDGRTLAISQYSALFSILGTTYGGNGQSTFALPDLRGRGPVGAGQGPGLQQVDLGLPLGQENTTLTINQMPSHTHGTAGGAAVQASTATASTDNPQGNYLAKSVATSDGSAVNTYIPPSGAGTPVNMASAGNITIQPAGGSQPFSNRPPSLGLNYCICVAGLFPTRN